MIGVRKTILCLQWSQMRHDQLYHKDIVILPVADRLKHMALHFAKYVGDIADALDSKDDEKLRRALIDGYIISLASANALNVDLGKEVCTEQTDSEISLMDLGLQIAKARGQLTVDDNGFHRRFAHCTGRLAKACESVDHLEPYPFRDSMKEQVVALFKLFLAEAAIRQLDLAQQSKIRLRAVEERSIFDDLYRADGDTNRLLER